MSDIPRLVREVQWYGEEVRANERRIADAERDQARYERESATAKREFEDAERMVAQAKRTIEDLKRKAEADTRSLRQYEAQLKTAETVAHEGRQHAA